VVDRELERGLDLEVGVAPGGGLEVDDDQPALGVPLQAVEAPDQGGPRCL